MSNEELSVLYQQGNKDAIRELYENNMGLINSVARRFPGYDQEDLRQEAFFGIEQAATQWKKEGGSNFASFAYMWVLAAMASYVRSMGGCVRVPGYALSMIKKYKRAVNDLSITLGRTPTKKEIAKALSVTEKEIEQIECDLLAIQNKSIYDPVSDDDSITLEDTIADPGRQMENALDQIQNEQLAAVLWPMVDALGKTEAAMIRGRFVDCETYADIGQRLGISESQARNQNVKALSHLRKAHNIQKLRAFYDETFSRAIKGIGVNRFMIDWTSATERVAIKNVIGE